MLSCIKHTNLTCGRIFIPRIESLETDKGGMSELFGRNEQNYGNGESAKTQKTPRFVGVV